MLSRYSYVVHQQTTCKWISTVHSQKGSHLSVANQPHVRLSKANAATNKTPQGGIKTSRTKNIYYKNVQISVDQERPGVAKATLMGQEDPQWKLSERDYPQGEVVLGLEIRSHSVKGALVDTGNGEFVRPGVVAKIDEVTVENIIEAVKKVRLACEWRGPVGCSVTKAVWRLLGRDDDLVEEALLDALPESDGEVAVLLHSSAAAHAVFSFTDWKKELGRTVVCTVGLGFGVVLYEGGEDVGGDYTQLNWTWPTAFKALRNKLNFKGMTPPYPAETAELLGPEFFKSKEYNDWDEFLSFVAKYVQKVGDKLEPDLIVVFPTGDGADPRICKGMIELNERVKGDFRLELPPNRIIGGAIVKGAARGALEATLYSQRAEQQLIAALGNMLGGNQYSTPALPASKVMTVFDTLNVSADGQLDMKDIKEGTRVLGLNLTSKEAAGLLKRIKMKATGSREGGAVKNIRLDKEEFSNWCKEVYSNATVQMVQYSVEFKAALDDTRYDRTIVKFASMECRACKKFERSFEELAKKHPSIRFVTINLDQNDSTERLGHRLQIRGTPCFILYRGRNEVSRLLGGNVIKVQKAIEELEKDTSPVVEVNAEILNT